ncbi:non-homologous end-joining DNA ligase [Roseomonas sp. OT10]|uniref:non-homologous end-joining DNA ligase n=1 Tax=Roseomonas cutis TaxID=2897332 RepID=UPI001E579A8C|nr:non-homologous end-joining DNA ligase [Roseomonas sp. OT10]UFN47656.1 non-homologous end-joining DNA ligase [Roseomonas sp. OT10]
MASPDPLAPYRARRYFRRSPEPEGAAPRRRKAKAPLAFVVQKHDATRLHYDFRLELDGVLKSWAVTRGPSLDPADRRLAVQVEDHPLDYGGFEGVIGAGYGAGTVLLWDRGTWEPEGDDPEGDLAAGTLRFTLHGERLRGGWTLRRFRGEGSKPRWLLIKSRDAEARPGEGDALLEEATTSVASGRDLAGISGRPPKPAPAAKPTARRTAKPAEAKAPRAPKPPAGSAVLEGVTLSHPARIYWPGEDGAAPVTKRDLAEYLVAVAPRLLPQLADRPLTLVRAPEGIGGERFVQRHAGRGTSSHLRRLSPRGEEEPLVAVADVAGLVALAQSGTLEIHPWGARAPRLAQPDRLILDLDPADDLPFAAVVEAALALRERVRSLGLVPFCRTTGGKGLHLVAPIAPGATWPRLHAAAEAIGTALAGAEPGRFTTSQAKADRPGRIFLDVQRNARGASAVASWSPRARPGAPVAMPLDWVEVTPALDPRAFTLRTAPRRLDAPDPWAGMEAAARPLPRRAPESGAAPPVL